MFLRFALRKKRGKREAAKPRFLVLRRRTLTVGAALLAALAIFGAVSGAGIFGAQYYGKGDWDGVRQTFRFKLLVCTALTVLGAGIFLLFGEDLILLYLKGDGSPEQIAASLGYAKEYLLIMLVGFIPFTLSQCYSGTLRETGQTVVPMVSGVVSVVVNLCFNTLLIFGHLGFPKLGSAGAAIATVLAQAVSVVLAVALLIKKKLPFAITRGLSIQSSM